jgi:hypothetical protein
MPNKIQCASPSEAGWLLEVGVIGVDKTLKIMRWGRWTLLEVEWLLRGMKDYPRIIRKKEVSLLSSDHKKLLPWMELPVSPVLADRWQPAFEFLLKLEERGKINKGKKTSDLPSESPYRRPLSSWRITREDALLVASPYVARLIQPDFDQGSRDLKKLKRIKACSVLLGDALQVLAGKRKALRKRYSGEVESTLLQINRCRNKAQAIITESLNNESRRYQSDEPLEKKWGRQNGKVN